MGRNPISLRRDQVRDVDHRAVKEYGMSGLVLMENAGRGAADLLLNGGVNGPVVVCCGKGNNGGDGFVIARHLEAAGVTVDVLLAVGPNEFSGDAAFNLAILQKSGTSLREFDTTDEKTRALLNEAEWIIDALLGTGLSGEIRAPYDRMIAAINSAKASVLAVDLPSGLDCDEGRPHDPCVKASRTATFVARKAGFDAEGAEAWTGSVSVLPIGVPRSLLAAYNL
ncbi:MAG: NAD(P)H-hydrate epimerase [Planctomycetaceae bacterium]|nr:NAD(P)H-hydrate epimerase [Planctomycetaceae bacterium]